MSTKKEVDWSTYPCDTCGLYKANDECVCGRLDEWSQRQEESSGNTPQEETIEKE